MSKYERTIFFAVVLAGLIAGIFVFHSGIVAVSQEAVVRSAVASEMLGGTVEGRQGLIGSLKWAPLPTMLQMPFVKIPGIGRTGLAFPVVNAVISAFTLSLLNLWWARFEIPRLIRFPLLAAFQLSPPVLGAVLTGTSSTLMLFLLVAGAYFLVDWMATLNLRSLAYVGVFAALAVITNYQTVTVALVVLAAIVLRVSRERTRSYRPATALVFLIPIFYVVILWFAANWLIVGDPLFFLRGILSKARLRAEIAGVDVDWTLYALPLLFLLAGFINRRFAHRATVRHGLRVVLILLTLLGAVIWPYVSELGGMLIGGTSRQAAASEVHGSYFGRFLAELAEVDEIVTWLHGEYPDAKVFVSGYAGFTFVERAKSPEMFVHLMNLDVREIQRRTAGQTLFFLVPRPEGIHRWDDINLAAPWLYADFLRHTLKDGPVEMGFVAVPGATWPHWRLIRVTSVE